MTASDWRPIRTKGGLTVWTCRVTCKTNTRHFAMVRRDRDGLRVTRRRVFLPVRRNHMTALYQAFSDVVTPELAAVINGLDGRQEHLHAAVPYIEKLENALVAHMGWK